MGGAVGAIIGFFGGIVQAVAAIFATAAGLTFFIVLWKSGALPPLLEIPGITIGGFFGAIGKGFEFLTEALRLARS